jgi:predicted ATPase
MSRSCKAARNAAAVLGATRERVLREITDALESITAETALLLVLEDLQWVDDSTVDLISSRHWLGGGPSQD